LSSPLPPPPTSPLFPYTTLFRSPEFAVPPLNKLIEFGHQILAVFTQPDRPRGRKQIVTPPPVKVFAAECGIHIFQPLKIKTAEADRKSTRLNSSHQIISYAVFCL